VYIVPGDKQVALVSAGGQFAFTEVLPGLHALVVRPLDASSNGDATGHTRPEETAGRLPLDTGRGWAEYDALRHSALVAAANARPPGKAPTALTAVPQAQVAR
jgi:hypothetical protein